MTVSSDQTAFPRLLRVPQVAEHYGLTERYVRRLIAERRVAFTKLGRLVLLDRDDVDALIAKSRVEAVR